MDLLVSRFRSLLSEILGSREDVSSPGGPSLYPPSQASALRAHVPSMDEYRALYQQSVEDPQAFWGQVARDFHWEVPPHKDRFLAYNFHVGQGPIFVRWMEGARTNICYNVLDRHVRDGRGSNVAFHWEGNDPTDQSKITYDDLLKEVCKFSNVLKSVGVKKGDRVALYMPMVIEAVVAMLACARLGAIHSVVFGGFSADSLSDRILNAKCKVLVTSDGVWRGDKLVHLKEICDEAIALCEKQNHKLDAVFVVQHLPRLNASKSAGHCVVNGDKSVWMEGRDLWWQEAMAKASDQCDPEWVDAEDPLFMLYTSGSTGTPKGVLHTSGGYLLYAATTFKYVFDYHPGDVFWCTADIGWITGHTYVVYGPLANGATSVLFEGTPFYPDKDRYWAVIEKYKVSKFYTAPTAIRALMKFGEENVTRHNRDSLKVLGSVGEPINPEAWLWYYNVVGNGKCPIVDTFWQTETGGHVLTPLPGCTPAKPGSACFPFFGVVPAILDENGKEITGSGEGYLVFKKPWPGIMRTVYGNHERFESVYFQKFPGYYCTGDGAKRDEDGYYWITGRIDDMLNVSGHLLSTAQIESAVIEHRGVAEAAVVPHPHSVKGECLYCFVTTKDGVEFTKELVDGIKMKVREKIGPFASPEYIQHAPALPKTRSGKIMRRILRKIARNDRDLGDVSTLADPGVIEVLFEKRPPNVKA